MKLCLATALAAVIAAGCASAETYDLTIASSHSTALPWVAPLSTVIVARTNERLEAMGSPDRVNWTEAYGGALYGYTDTLEAVGDGLTDAGWVGTLWEESKMPLQNLTYYAPFTTDDPVLILNTFNRLHADLPFLQEAWAAQNTVFLGSTGADTYHLFTTFPVTSLEDLKGRKILAPGPSAAWVAAAGAVPVDGSLTTYYNQIETGVAEGVLTIMTGAAPLKIHEVAPHVTLAGIGANLIGGFAVNKESWDALSPDVQKVLTELGHDYSAENAALISTRYQAIVDGYRADPKVTVTELPLEERKKWAAALPDLAGDWAARTPHGAELLGAYMEAIRAGGGQPLRDWSAAP